MGRLQVEAAARHTRAFPFANCKSESKVEGSCAFCVYFFIADCHRQIDLIGEGCALPLIGRCCLISRWMRFRV